MRAARERKAATPASARTTARVAVVAIAVVAIAIVSGGCARQEERMTSGPGSSSLPVMQAVRSDTPVTVDGVLDEAVWRDAISYPLQLGADHAGRGEVLEEGGRVRLAWDPDHLWIGIDWEDRDIIAKGTKDHEHHYELGDLCEVFLRPEGFSRYWELYVTPAGRKTCFWFERRGADIQTDRDFGLRVAARLEGTLNDSSTADRGWTAEMAVPASDLTAHGASFGPGVPWRILVARYNYSQRRGWDRPEYSMTPRLSRTDYHLIEEHARLELVE